jgi:1-acyl-sn-glycerol-3-phosphate acyltransferase
MLKFLRGPILGTIAAVLWVLNTLFWTSFFFVIALLKLVVPNKTWRYACTAILDDISSHWMSVNSCFINFFIGVKWEVVGDVQLKMQDWYLVLANHQSWADIVVLMQVLNRRIPLLKFFLKKQLIYVPILGFTWWALDYPFMKRYSAKQLSKKPHLRGKDLETTRRACEKFKKMPISIMNFVEGTRYTALKYAKQSSAFKFLLNPRAGGIANTLQAMGDQLTSIIDVTIVYPAKINSLWQLMCGKIGTIKIFLRQIPITPQLIGDYQNDPLFRAKFQEWLNKIWHEKDQLLIEAHDGQLP